MALICAPGDDAGLLPHQLPAARLAGPREAAARRADLIQLTLQGDRHGGSAVDYTVNARIGMPLHDRPGRRRRTPVNHVLPAWDLVTGQMVAVGLLAAERHRRRTGEGQHVKLALEDVALAVMGHLGFIAEAQLRPAARAPRQRAVRRLRARFPYRRRRARDGGRPDAASSGASLCEATATGRGDGRSSARGSAWTSRAGRQPLPGARARSPTLVGALDRRAAPAGSGGGLRPLRRLLEPLPDHRRTGAATIRSARRPIRCSARSSSPVSGRCWPPGIPLDFRRAAAPAAAAGAAAGRAHRGGAVAVARPGHGALRAPAGQGCGRDCRRLARHPEKPRQID